MVAPAIIAGGLSLLGGLFNGVGQGQISQAQLQEMMRQFNAQNQLAQRGQSQSEMGTASGLGNQQAMLPMRDQAAFALQQRMGGAPRFVPHDIFNPQNGPAQQGGFDPSKMPQYTPGAGGLTGQSSLYDIMLKNLGYNHDQATGQYSGTGVPPATAQPKAPVIQPGVTNPWARNVFGMGPLDSQQQAPPPGGAPSMDPLVANQSQQPQSWAPWMRGR